MSRGVQVVVVCEDLQHSVFVRAFLAEKGFIGRQLRVEISGRGDAKQFVREKFPLEVSALQKYPGVGRMLIVMTDADEQTVAARKESLLKACRDSNVNPPNDTDRVFIYVPKREIETWIHYLAGNPVDEDRNYPKLAHQSDARPQIKKLVQMCNDARLAPTPPASLESACSEFARMQQMLAGR